MFATFTQPKYFQLSSEMWELDPPHFGYIQLQFNIVKHCLKQKTTINWQRCSDMSVDKILNSEFPKYFILFSGVLMC